MKMQLSDDEKILIVALRKTSIPPKLALALIHNELPFACKDVDARIIDYLYAFWERMADPE